MLLCTIMVSCLSYTAIVRYFLPFQFFTNLSHMAEELAVYSFVWLLYFGSVLATREGSHFRVSAQLALLPKRLQPWRFLVGDLLWLGFCLFAAWQGTRLVLITFQRSEPSMSLGIPMGFVYAIIPLAFALTALRLVQTYIRGVQVRDEAEDIVKGRISG